MVVPADQVLKFYNYYRVNGGDGRVVRVGGRLGGYAGCQRATTGKRYSALDQ